MATLHTDLNIFPLRKLHSRIVLCTPQIIRDLGLWCPFTKWQIHFALQVDKDGKKNKKKIGSTGLDVKTISASLLIFSDYASTAEWLCLY